MPLVQALLQDQHPDLAGLPVRLAATGWDNSTYRLGDELAVRLPRIGVAAGLIRNEQRWLPELAPRLPVPVPVPVRIGEPGHGYPWPWSVVPWVPGESAASCPLLPSQAARFGQFLAAVHQPAPADAPRNDYRGVPLPSRTETVHARLDRLAVVGELLEVPLTDLRQRWAALAAAPIDLEDTWVHGDLHPKNIVSDQGRLAAVLDWGDLTVGDRATDLGAAWLHFPPQVLPTVWRAYGPVSADTLLRAEGWALFFGVVLLDAGLVDADPLFTGIGRRTLAQLGPDGRGPVPVSSGALDG